MSPQKSPQNWVLNADEIAAITAASRPFLDPERADAALRDREERSGFAVCVGEPLAASAKHDDGRRARRHPRHARARRQHRHAPAGRGELSDNQTSRVVEFGAVVATVAAVVALLAQHARRHPRHAVAAGVVVLTAATGRPTIITPAAAVAGMFWIARKGHAPRLPAGASARSGGYAPADSWSSLARSSRRRGIGTGRVSHTAIVPRLTPSRRANFGAAESSLLLHLPQ